MLYALAAIFAALALTVWCGEYFGYTEDLINQLEPTQTLAFVTIATSDFMGDGAEAASAYLDSILESVGVVDKPKPLPAPVYSREDVLNDYDKRIDPDFAIPPELRDRVAFWFDIYTKYDSNHRLVQYDLYPWIIFEVIDVTPIIEADQPSHRWLRNEKADRLVKNRELEIRKALLSLAHRGRHAKPMTETEQMVATALKPLGGDLKKQAARAAKYVRVQTGQKNFFTEGLSISPRYMPTMEKIFRDKKMPVELTRLPFVESSFNKLATSKVGASGIWQFMGDTGRKFMRVSGKIDERLSPYKATEAAASLLKENHMILHHSWPLAVTAWNHGPTGMRKAIRRTHSQDLATIISKYHTHNFDFASANFYSEFLAALHAEKYNEEIFGTLAHEPSIELEAVRLPRAIHFEDLLHVSGLTREQILTFNPELYEVAKGNSSLPAGFRLHVPASALSSIERELSESAPTVARKSAYRSRKKQIIISSISK
jgi:membrane-bound lytic murein transglycosylase D